MRRALLIASSDYRDSAFTRLQFPEDDARLMKGLLEDPALCGFKEVDVLSNPTRDQAHRAVESLTASCGPDDMALLYFSGHGKLAKDGTLALVLNDTEETMLFSTGLLSDNLRALFNESRAGQKVIILDSCNSGAAGDAMFKGGESEAFQAAAEITGTFLLTASTKFKRAYECAELEGSAMTACLVEGVRSGAAAGKEAQVISLADLGSYVTREVPRRSAQQPKYWDFGGVGSAMFSHRPRMFDDAWRSSATDALHRLRAEKEIDDAILDMLRNALAADDRDPERLELIDRLVTGAIKPGPFMQRWGDLPTRGKAAPLEQEAIPAPSKPELAKEGVATGAGVSPDELAALRANYLRVIGISAMLGVIVALIGVALIGVGLTPDFYWLFFCSALILAVAVGIRLTRKISTPGIVVGGILGAVFYLLATTLTAALIYPLVRSSGLNF